MNQPTDSPANSHATSAHHDPPQAVSALLRPITLRWICGIVGTLYTIFAGYFALCICVAIAIPLFARAYDYPPESLADYAAIYGPGILIMLVGLPICFIAISMLFCLVTNLLVNRVASRCIFKATLAYHMMPAHVRRTLFRKTQAPSTARSDT